MRPVFKSATLVSLIALAFCSCANSPSFAQVIKPVVDSGFATAWTRTLEPLVDLCISPGGHFLALLTHSGKLSVWDVNSGTTAWSVQGITQHNVVVSDTSGIAATYDSMNRLDTSVNVYGPASHAQAKGGATPQLTGKKLFKAYLDGAVWCSSTSPDGKYFAFGDGARQISLVELDPAVTPVGPYPVDGIPNEISFSRDSRTMVAGLWNQSGVETVDLFGRILTSFLGPNVRRYDISISPTSQEVLALAYYNRQNLHPVISLLDKYANLEWSYDTGDGTSDAKAIVGNDAQVSYISFTQTSRRAHQTSKTERYLSAIDSTGNLMWNKGGLFMQPRLICLAPNGSSVIVYDGDRTLYKFGSDGSREGRFELPARLQQLYSVSGNNRRLIVYLIDGTLMRIDIS